MKVRAEDLKNHHEVTKIHMNFRLPHKDFTLEKKRILMKYENKLRDERS